MNSQRKNSRPNGEFEIDLLEMLGEQNLPQPVTDREYVLL